MCMPVLLMEPIPAHPGTRVEQSIRNDRQISIVSAEELALIAKELHVPEVKPEWLGANLLISGIPNLSAPVMGFTPGIQQRGSVISTS